MDIGSPRRVCSCSLCLRAPGWGCPDSRRAAPWFFVLWESMVVCSFSSCFTCLTCQNGTAQIKFYLVQGLTTPSLLMNPHCQIARTNWHPSKRISNKHTKIRRPLPEVTIFSTLFKVTSRRLHAKLELW